MQRVRALFRRLSSTQAPITKSSRLSWKVVVPVTLVAGYIAGDRYLAYVNDDQSIDPKKKLLRSSTLQVLQTLPTRLGSRLWGSMNEVDLPIWARRPILSLYSWAFNCNLDEASNSDLMSYPNLQRFFGRKLKTGARIVDESSPIVSPADCKVLFFGEMEHGQVEQVKGITYKVEDFLGNKPTAQAGNKVFQIVLYLAPGDYHHFHSPAVWTPDHASHFHGHLFSVSPIAAKLIPSLFVLNERVVLSGSWKHGYFSYVAVGAYNVGSIVIDLWPGLVTNSSKQGPQSLPQQRALDQKHELKAGDHVGAFRLGSTVVLIFEAPENFRFVVRPNQKLQYGQSIGTMTPPPQQ